MFAKNYNLDKAIELYIEQVYKSYYRKAVNYANQFLKDTELSKEMAQEAFVSIWEKRDVLDIHCNIEYYLMATVRNKALNHLKHKQRVASRMGTEVSVSDRLSIIALNDDSSQKVICKELSDIVDKTLDTMSPDIRETFLMSREEGLSYKEIAEKSNVSIKTIEYRITKALKLLTAQLSEFLTILLLLLLG